MSNKSVIIILTLLMVLSMIFISTSVFAYDPYTPDEFKSKIDTTGDGPNNVKATGGKVVGIIQIVGTIAAVGMIMVLGIKYMMGSAEEKASYKKTMLPYLIGAVLLFGAANIAKIVYTWASNV